MNRLFIRFLALVTVMCLAMGIGVSFADEAADEAVQAVIVQLEAIDTLEQMQAKRYTYSVNTRYNVDTTDEAIKTEHETARAGYEEYVSAMFAARIAAQQAYDALTAEQQAQIDAELVAKLDNELSNVFNSGTFEVTPSDNEYTFETVYGGKGYAYEVSNHMVSGNIPQTFVLVDTSDGKTSWTPSGLYEYGESNYEVVYCCDVETGLEYNFDYKRLNLEDSSYYSDSSASHIRAILLNSYPYITMDEMKERLIEGGLSSTFVDSLTRADMIAATQLAIWSYANAADGASDGVEYFASVSVLKNQGYYFTAMHDYTNECWEWHPGMYKTSYDARAAYRVNTLGYYLCRLPGVEAADDEIVISDVEITRADLLPGADDTYRLGMYVKLNNGGDENDNIKVTITSYSVSDDGTRTVTAQSNQVVSGREILEMSVKAKSNDIVSVVVDGTQTLEKGVYFYEPEGGRDISQCLVGVGEGETRVHAEEEFVFIENIGNQGLRIYKSETETGDPISDITFKVYSVVPGEGEVLSAVPTAEEIAKYQTEENLIVSLTTDATGYAGTPLEEGCYMVVEVFNEEKIKAPVDPFYITIPMDTEKVNEDGTTTVETVEIVSVYPKNELVVPPDVPPVVPPTPDNVAGKFGIVKYDEADESKKLAGAQFEVYRAATADDTDTSIVVCDGVQYAVVPVTVDGVQLVLTTDENGSAVSPELTCGVYFLVEVKAPAGYNLLDGAVSVTVVSSELTEVTTVEIANQRGALLPETGGMGAEKFWMAGGMLVMAAAVVLIAKRRADVNR